jgi:parallel beta-helix repeat protein
MICERFFCLSILVIALTVGSKANASDYGPQSYITCPSGSVDISPGTSVQSIVNAYSGSTSFCIKAGIHYLRGSIVPKTGNVFVGEYGAVLDGTGWSTSDESAAAFRGPEDIDRVVIKNLVIRNMPQKGVWADRDRAAYWTVEHCDLSYNKWGVVLTAGAAILRNFIHHNSVGGYTLYMTNLFPGTVATIEQNEIAYNGGHPENALGYLQKSIDGGTVIWRRNWIHHNVAAGIWNDGDGNGSIIEDNVVEDNDHGIHWELSVNGIIRRNTVRRNKDTGIYLSTSRDTLVENNIVEDNFRGITIFVNCYSTTQGWAWGADLRNNTIRNNTIKMSTRSGEIPALFSYAGAAFSGGVQTNGCTDQQVQPYLTNSKNNWFIANSYFVPDFTSWWWLWAPRTYSFSSWQSLGQDTAGSIQLASNYSSSQTPNSGPTPSHTNADSGSSRDAVSRNFRFGGVVSELTDCPDGLSSHGEFQWNCQSNFIQLDRILYSRSF